MSSYYSNFRDVNHALPILSRELLAQPVEQSRGGPVRAVHHVSLTLNDPLSRYITVPGRKHNIAAQIAETMWVLAGRNDINWLSRYLPRAGDFSDDGTTWRAGYGTRMRRFGFTGVRQATTGGIYVDQLRYVVEELWQDPASRRAVISLWDPRQDTFPGKDIPCNDWLSFDVSGGVLCLTVGVRSNDLVWGWSGINQFEWSVLLEIVARLVNLPVGTLHFSITNLHAYERHWNKLGKIGKAENESLRFELSSSSSSTRPAHRFGSVQGYIGFDDLDNLIQRWFEAEHLIRGYYHPDEPRTEDERRAAYRDMATRVGNFPDGMLRSWLRVIGWWWSGGQHSWLSPLMGSQLYDSAVNYSVQPPAPEREVTQLLDGNGTVLAVTAHRNEQLQDRGFTSEFVQELVRLHNDKAAAYGDSWMRRGETMAIMANIARKVDRLGGGDTDDETAADTAGDLFVYLAKYRGWLVDQGVGKFPVPLPRDYRSGWCSEHPDYANWIMCGVDMDHREIWPVQGNLESIEAEIKRLFDEDLTDMVAEGLDDRWKTVDHLMKLAYRLARFRWDIALASAEHDGDDYRGADAD